jgi:hypothetical protein
MKKLGIKNTTKALKIEKNLIFFMNVFFVLVAKVLALLTGGTLKNTLDQPSFNKLIGGLSIPETSIQMKD